MITRAGWTPELAVSTIVSRLNAEIIQAVAEHVLWRPVGGTPERTCLSVIPARHWNPDSEWLCDSALWRTGDVYFDLTGRSNFSVSFEGRISYFGIRFDPEAIQQIVEAAAADAPSGMESSERQGDQAAAAGRRMSDRWRPWIAELVAYVHEHGIPAGVGSQGQEELIEAISEALAAGGQESLARSTVQPVVQAVLDRLRSAEN